MKATNDFEDARVEAFLAPLAKVAPATRHAHRPLRVRRLGLALAGALLLAGGVAVAATNVFGPAHYIDNTPSPSSWTCSGLIGESGADVGAYLQAHGYSVAAGAKPGPHQASWRFLTYSDTVLRQPNGSTPGAIEGHSEVVPGPPPGSVVSNILAVSADPPSLIVFTQAANDPNAPQVTAPQCAAKK